MNSLAATETLQRSRSLQLAFRIPGWLFCVLLVSSILGLSGLINWISPTDYQKVWSENLAHQGCPYLAVRMESLPKQEANWDRYDSYRRMCVTEKSVQDGQPSRLLGSGSLDAGYVQ